MPKPKNPTANRRSHASSAGVTLAMLLGTTSAHAQATSVHVDGKHVVANQQIAPSGSTVATATTEAAPLSTGSLTGAAVNSTAGRKTARAVTNAADLAVAPEGVAPAAAPGATTLSVGAQGVRASGGTAIGNWQDAGTSFVRAVSTGGASGIASGNIMDSSVTATDNSAEAAAFGNLVTSDLALAGDSASAGGGIASRQIRAEGSTLAGARDQVTISTGAVSGSSLSNTDNLVRATASGNSASQALATDTGALLAPPATSYAASVTFNEAGDASASGAVAVLNDQSTGGIVKAVTGAGAAPSFVTAVDGSVQDSVLETDRNALTAAGYGNQSHNALDVSATSIGRASNGQAPKSGAVAVVGNHQRLADTATIDSTSTGSARAAVATTLTNGTVSVSDNTARTIAAGNAATGNTLTVSAGTVEVAGVGWSTDPEGSALSGSGGARVNAAFAVQNVQDYGAAWVTAGRSGRIADLTIGGAVADSAARIDGNTDLVMASGNNALNTVDLEAVALRGAVALGSLQSGDGDVAATLGTSEARGGDLIQLSGPVAQGRMSVSGNQSTATAIAQTATNNLFVDAATIGDATAGTGTSGALPGSTQGATGDVALTNNQKLAQPSFGDTGMPAVSSSAFGAYGVAATQAVQGSSVAIDGNAQSASALGNSAVNRLGVTAAGPAAGGATPSVSLFSAQYGQGDFSATSDVSLVAPEVLVSSSLTQSGNTNIAVAAVNDADSRMSVTGLGRGTGQPASALNETSVPQASGQISATSQQYAGGSVKAVATTRTGAGPSTSIENTTVSIADNLTRAEASGNRALNAIGGVDAASLALVAKQTSLASVSATAGTDGGLSGGSGMAGSRLVLTGNALSAVARGNAAENVLSLDSAGTTRSASATLASPLASASADAALINVQTNYGQVTAMAAYAPLTSTGSVRGASLRETDNAVLATANGNLATNSIVTSSPAGMPSASLANLQFNVAVVTAQATAQPGQVFGPITGSRMSMTGSQLSAIATGNQAVNTISAAR